MWSRDVDIALALVGIMLLLIPGLAIGFDKPFYRPVLAEEHGRNALKK